MSPNRSTETTSLAGGALGACLLLLAACGQQAGDDYRGEPLLRMRGQAVVSALTGGQAVEPALCFFAADEPVPPAFDPNTLPPDIRAELSAAGFLEVEVINKQRAATHILDVESRGEFPAQFDVDVYLPPPDIGLSAPWVAGETRFARGMVCAVPTEHPAVSFRLASGGHADTVIGEFRYAIASTQTPRFYYEAYDCPPGTLPQFATTECTKSSAGDPSLAYEFPIAEFHSEFVIGIADEFEVLYLDEPALPGSFTAWYWGAANGLSAGYHLLPVLPVTEPSPEQLECSTEAIRESERMNYELYDARIKQELGEEYSYNGLEARNWDGSSIVPLPEDIFLGAREVEARQMMEHCPMQPRAELDPSVAMLSIDISSNATPDLSQHFGFVTIGGEE